MLIPYRPESPIVQRITYQTAVIRTHDGHEYRQANMVKPREHYELSYLLTEAQTRAIRAMLFNDPDAAHKIPAWQEETEIAAEVTGSTVDIGGAGEIAARDWMANGQAVYLLRADGTGEENEIASASSNISLTNSVSANFAAGSTILPLREVKLTGSTALGRYPIALGQWNVQLAQSEFVVTWGNGATLTTVSSLPVLERQPISQGVDQEDVHTGIGVIDFGAEFTVERHWGFSDFGRPLTFYVEDHDDRQYWRKFLDTIIGGQGDFWLSTWRDDLPLASAPSATDTELTAVDPPDYDTDWFTSLAHKRVALHLDDGTVLYRGVTGATDNGNTQTLTLDSALPDPLSPVDRVAFLERCRIEDSVSFQHWGGGGVESLVSVTARVVQQ